MPTLTVNPHASNGKPTFSATPFTFPGGRYGVGTAAQRLIFGAMAAEFARDEMVRAILDEVKQG